MNERIIVGLDIGTTKICTVIGEVANDGVLDIIGEGTVPSDGLRKGVVVNLERTIASVRQSILAAQRMAGVEVTHAWVGVAGSHLKAFTSHGMAAIRRGLDITPSDVERTIENAKAVPMETNMEVIHVIPQEYVVDGNDGIKDPIGMSGVRLEVDVHVIAGAQGPLQNLKRCARDAGAEVEGMVIQALASGLAVLETGEQEVTTLLIDIGGGTTDVGVFRRGTLTHSAVIPLGGDHITQDISQLLRIPPDEAERVKKRYGVAIPDLADRDVVLEVANQNFTASLTTFELAQVIRPRVTEILDLVKQNVEQHMGALELLAGNVVITGGASMMVGLDRVAEDRFRLPVRVGKPHGFSGLTDIVSSPAHATAVGLVRYGMQYGSGFSTSNTRTRSDSSDLTTTGSDSNLLSKVRNILKEFF
ncbi:MAG: cell division protein FtsA [Trueperaceae bacterium]